MVNHTYSDVTDPQLYSCTNIPVWEVWPYAMIPVMIFLTILSSLDAECSDDKASLPPCSLALVDARSLPLFPLIWIHTDTRNLGHIYAFYLSGGKDTEY